MYCTQHDRVSDQGESSLGDILRDLSKNAIDLVRGGVLLAAAEMSRKVSSAWKDSQLITIGAFITNAGLLLILAAAVIALSLVIPVGWAAFAVGVAALIAGAITIRIGKRRISETDLLPRETIDTLKEDTKWTRKRLM